jgi:hypothetical protein
LKVQPKLRAGTKSLGKQPGRFRCNPPLATHNFIDPLNGYTESICTYLRFSRF